MIEAKTINILQIRNVIFMLKRKNMRGSVYYQASQLVLQVFVEGAKKEDRVNPQHEHYQMVASYKTMESYKNVWENFFNYLKEHWNIKDFEKIESEHIQAYMEYKVEYYPSKQYLEKISASLGKLEIALTKFSKNISKHKREYNFSIRQTILDNARDFKLVANNYHNRAYSNPELLITNLKEPLHQLAAKIQYEGGARIEGMALIKYEQLKGRKIDSVTNKEVGILVTKEKGGKVGDILINLDTYKKLENYLEESKIFKINRQSYYNDIKQAAIISNENLEGSHGLRWNFAKRRMFEYGKARYKFEECLLEVSNEMKHNRASITQHYLI